MSAVIFNYDEFKDLAKIGGLDQVEKEFDKDVLDNKSLVNKIGDISKITFEQKKFVLYRESSYITHAIYTKLNKKKSNIWFNINISNWYSGNHKLSKTRK